jgi:hypothetical protein
LFTASGSNIFQTPNVQDQISSPAHNAKYDPTLDDKLLPTPPMTSIADWFRTSVDPLGYGWSYLSYADDAFIGYTNYRGYTFNAWYEQFGTEFAWTDLTNEINAGRPMMFLVDYTGDGVTDHFVPVLGYDEKDDGRRWYALYTTWDESETIAWAPFRGMSSSYRWGVGYATFVNPVSAPVPEPTTMFLLGSGLLGIAGLRKRFKI